MYIMHTINELVILQPNLLKIALIFLFVSIYKKKLQYLYKTFTIQSLEVILITSNHSIVKCGINYIAKFHRLFYYCIYLKMKLI